MEELFSEGAVGALEALSRYRRDSKSSPQNYAMIRAIGAMRDWVRRDSHLHRATNTSPRHVSLDSPIFDDSEKTLETRLIDPRPTAEQDLIRREAMSLAGLEIAQRSREVVAYVSRGYSRRETAKRFGLSPGRITQILDAVRRKVYLSRGQSGGFRNRRSSGRILGHVGV